MQTSRLIFADVAFTKKNFWICIPDFYHFAMMSTRVKGTKKNQSGKRDSNPRPSAWEAIS